MKFFSALLTCLLALSIPALAADPEAAPWKEFHFDDKEAGLSAVVLHRQSTNEWKLQLLSESAKPQPMTLAVRKVIDGDGVLYQIFFWVPGAALECIPSCRAQFTFDDDEPVVLGLTKGEEDGPAVYYVDQVAPSSIVFPAPGGLSSRRHSTRRSWRTTTSTSRRLPGPLAEGQ